MKNESPPSVASSPFDDPNDADITLRSADGVDFHVYRAILGAASPIFKQMWTLPQATKDHPQIDDATLVSEDSTTLDRLLRFIYPTRDPDLESDLQSVGAVLKAAAKYDIEYLEERLRKTLSAFDDPLRVYAIATSAHLGYEQEALQAVVEWCESDELSLSSYVPEMDDISAGVYFRALQFYARHQNRDKRDCSLPGKYTFCYPEPSCAHSHPEKEQLVIPSPFDQPSPLTDIIVHSSDDHHFYANKAILTYASSVLADKIEDAMKSGPKSEDENCALHLNLSGRTLLHLLQLCHPAGAAPSLDDWDELTTVIDAAASYKMTRALEYAKSKWAERIAARPMQSYLFAMQRGWTADATTAARYAMLLSSDDYIPEMERVSASVYRRFLEYRQKWREAVVKASHVKFMTTLGTEERRYGSIYWSDEDVREWLEYQWHAVSLLCGAGLLCADTGRTQGGDGVQKRIEGLLFSAGHAWMGSMASGAPQNMENVMVKVFQRILKVASEIEL
ncbi:uncharacterized protein LAESUDRAFT_813946 [Laetiporus sulphureus 93-53]|uniref:BTB domain-containing protein n=1 Tax=Laetiporus sulphureus 93-53 TaxID=1314785 RepID=A0A165DGV1_9APHY|nr:uncharacterized protein LAESUDRAFT_813946 [Laetiporus sulphureus 93-53]KZT04850.1 hypothetical protein LAESUDRAFT_813946 [Laetiporus sulphureus 93-53]